VEFVILYRPPDDQGKELALSVANGCLLGEDYVLTSSEALEFAMGAAPLKNGRVAIVFNLCFYEFQPEPVDSATGLVLCKLTKRCKGQTGDLPRTKRCKAQIADLTP
jgi:hypothetical protein